MKTRTPLDRNDLQIQKKDKVIEIGSGHNPSFRANVIVEKYIYDNTQRCDKAKFIPTKPLSMQTEKICPLKIKSLIMPFAARYWNMSNIRISLLQNNAV